MKGGEEEKKPKEIRIHSEFGPEYDLILRRQIVNGVPVYTGNVRKQLQEYFEGRLPDIRLDNKGGKNA